MALAKRSEKGLLPHDNCVVTIIDLQPQMLFGVRNFDRQTIINNNLVLLKAAKVFGVPVVLSTVETHGFSGDMWSDPGHLPRAETQYRGGSPGFLKVIDEHTLGFADFGGNRQYITLGNLADNAKGFIFVP